MITGCFAESRGPIPFAAQLNMHNAGRLDSFLICIRLQDNLENYYFDMRKLETAGLLLLGLLFFVWPISHTATLRDLLLVLNLALFGYLAWQKGWPGKVLWKLSLPAAILLVMTLWMYVVAFIISAETAWSLGEIHSQWWRALVALLIGVCAALTARQNPRFGQKIWLVLFAVLMLHILYVDFVTVVEWLTPGPDERVEGLTGGPDMSSYLTNMLFGFLLAELFYRTVYKKRALPVHRAFLAMAWVLALISVFGELTRNAVVTLVFMVLLLGVLYLSGQRGRLKRSFLFAGAGLMFLVVLVGVGLVATARESSSLGNLMATVPIAWDTEHNKAWQDPNRYDWPKLSNGETVDTSMYQRIAWLKEGLMLVREHPLGVGYGRNAYGHGMKLKYGAGYGHSHSGLLDIMIGIGIPGGMLWIAFIASLVFLSYKRAWTSQNYAAVLLFLLLLDYGARTLLDSIQRDHMLQQFMFLAGLAAVMMATQVKANDPDKPTRTDG